MSNAKKILDIFSKYGLNKDQLTPEDQDLFPEFLENWSRNSWTLDFLKSFIIIDPIEQPQLKYIFLDQVYPRASSLEKLQELQSLHQKRLAKVNPPVDLTYVDGVDMSQVFKTPNDVEKAKKEGILINPTTQAILGSKNIFIKKDLANLLNKLDEALLNAGLGNTFIFSSGTRNLMEQQILYSLGYPAAKLSNHNFGNAIDLRIRMEIQEEQLDKDLGYIKENSAENKYEFIASKNNNLNLILEINALAKKDLPLSLKTLEENNILQKSAALIKLKRAYDIIENFQLAKLQILDESPFFSYSPMPVKVENLKDKIYSTRFIPDFHVQIKK